MTYLSRPLLETKPNWLKSPVFESTFDLRGIRLGFGSSTFSPTANHPTRSWSCEFTFFTPFEFAAFQDFTASRYGRLDGFWFPNLAFQFLVVTGVSDTVFEIATQNLAATWSDDASAHLYAIKPDGATVAVAISGVTTPSAGIERITVSTSLGGTPDAGWHFYRLLYVRLADDEERSTAHCEGVYTQSVKVVELPEEYAAAETGQAPIYLYDLYQDNGDATTYHWRYTSFAIEQISSGDTFTAATITHGSVKGTTKPERSSLTISTVWAAGTPWALQLPFPSTRPLHLKIYEITAGAPNVRRIIFAGECSGVTFTGTEVSASFDHWFDSMRRQLPGRTIQRNCHYQLYDPDSCKAVATSYVNPDFQLSVTITSISGFTASITHAKFASNPAHYPTDFFKGGRIRTGVAPTIEERMIVASSAATAGGVVLQLSQKIIHQTTPVSATALRGCDRLYATCKNTFANHVNFPGFPDVPRISPTFKAIEVAGGTASKK